MNLKPWNVLAKAFKNWKSRKAGYLATSADSTTTAGSGAAASPVKVRAVPRGTLRRPTLWNGDLPPWRLPRKSCRDRRRVLGLRFWWKLSAMRPLTEKPVSGRRIPGCHLRLTAADRRRRRALTNKAMELAERATA